MYELKWINGTGPCCLVPCWHITTLISYPVCATEESHYICLTGPLRSTENNDSESSKEGLFSKQDYIEKAQIPPVGYTGYMVL